MIAAGPLKQTCSRVNDVDRAESRLDEEVPVHVRMFENQERCVGTGAESVSESSMYYSVSDISSWSCSSDRGKRSTLDNTPSMPFLPQFNNHSSSGEMLGLGWSNEKEFSLHFHPENEDYDQNNGEIENAKSKRLDSSAIYMSNKLDLTCELDIDNMIKKLEAEKEFLKGSFQKQPRLPLAWTTLPKESYIEKQKKGSLKMKERLHKFGKAARHFLDSKVFRRQPTVQRCEIQLYGFDDNIERLVLVTCQKDSHPVSKNKTVHISMPSFFETTRVSLPRPLLPSKPGDLVTVTMYGVKEQEVEGLPSFRKVLASGTCTIHYDSKALLTGRLELQPHRPCHSLTGHSKAVQSCGSSVTRKHVDSDHYTFSTMPEPVASDFTELCILQTAEPFREFLALDTSTCDHPASFQAHLAPGKYHAVGSYRLTQATGPEVFAVASATPTVFFKSHMDKAEVKAMMKQATELATRDFNKEPLLLPSLPLLKPPGLDLEQLMKVFPSGQTIKISKLHSTCSPAEKGLHFCAWDLTRAMNAHLSASGSRTEKTLCISNNSVTGDTNPRLPIASREYMQMPSLSVFSMSTRLYFADCWSYYDRHFVTLVLCTKGLPCDQVCKQHLHRLDPYDNPFLFRKRCIEPEPSISVYASGNVDVEIIYSNSDVILELASVCSENVYFSKVRVGDT